MEAADIDVLIVGREGNARYVSGAPRLWTAGSRAFGPGCVLVRESGAVHLLSTWDEGIPDDIPHENLYGISFNAMSFVKVLQGIQGAATARTVATDSMTGSSANLLPKAFPSAELIDGEPLLRRVRQVKAPEEIAAIRASVGIAEVALAEAAKALMPGVTERALTAVFMEAMASAGVTTPAGQDVAWLTSREHPWRRSSRDAAVQAGDLVAFEAGVISGGYVGEVGRTYSVGGGGVVDQELVRRFDELWDRLTAACRVGAPLHGLLNAYDESGGPSAPDARRPWAGARFRSSAGDTRAAAHGRRAGVRSGHGPGADGLRLERRRRRCLRSGAGCHHGIRTGTAFDDPLSRGKEPDHVTDADIPPPEEIILYEKDPATRIATITLNRPDQLNIPTIAARRRYADLLFKASIDDDVKVLVVRGVGDHLGTGADLDELMAKRAAGVALQEEFGLDEDDDVTMPNPRSYRAGASLLHWYGNTRSGCRTLQDFKKISILEVKGYCYGWHFYQAADADLVISSDDALFGHPAFRYVGYAPRMWQWAMMMGMRKFQEMVFTGRPFTAEQMYECNFVNSVVPREDLEAEVAKYAARVRPHEADRHRLHAEGVLRSHEAAPGRVHGQPAERLARIDGRTAPGGRRWRSGDPEQGDHGRRPESRRQGQ